MKIKILGNGGGVNDGLPFNSYIINEKHLIESPPDIMNSLFRENIDISKIETIYISHFHADHCFGLPFLALKMFLDSFEKNYNKIKIIGPEGIRDKTNELFRLGFGDQHPYFDWFNGNSEYIEISSSAEIYFNEKESIYITPFRMNHPVITWGFTLYNNCEPQLSYYPDTLWDESFIGHIKLNPRAIIADLNGEPSDPVKAHMSEADVIKNILPHCGDNTVIYGTHLRYQKESTHNRISYVYPGQVIEL